MLCRQYCPQLSLFSSHFFFIFTSLVSVSKQHVFPPTWNRHRDSNNWRIIVNSEWLSWIYVWCSVYILNHWNNCLLLIADTIKSCLGLELWAQLCYLCKSVIDLFLYIKLLSTVDSLLNKQLPSPGPFEPKNMVSVHPKSQK